MLSADVYCMIELRQKVQSGESPVEMLFNRKLNTRLDLLKDNE